MYLKLTSGAITRTLDTGDGATATKLLFPKGKLASDGKSAKWYVAQIVENNKIKLYEAIDLRGSSVVWSAKKFSTRFSLLKAGSLKYVNRITNNKNIINIFQQAAIWAFLEFDYSNQSFIRQIDLNSPDDGTIIDRISRHNNHLYYRTVLGSTQTLCYLDLQTIANNGNILSPTWTLSLTENKNEFVAGKEYLYLYTEVSAEPAIQRYLLGSQTVSGTWTDPILTETLNLYKVSLHEINKNTLYIRHANQNLFRIEDGISVKLNNDIQTDSTPESRIQTIYGSKLFVEGIDRVTSANVSDEHKDAWYIDDLVPLTVTPIENVIESICAEGNLSASDINTIALSAIDIDGFMVESEINGLGKLDQLASAYNFDYFEDAGKIYFTLRTTSPIAINSSYLAARNIDSFETSIIKSNIKYNNDIPQKISVEYINKSSDYTEASEMMERIGVVKNEQSINYLNFAFSKDKAKQIADIYLSVLQTEDREYALTTLLHYFKILPNDILSFSYDNLSLIMRVINTLYMNNMIQLQCVAHNADDYTSIATGNGNDDAEVIDVQDDVISLILDMPLLNNGDQSYNLYYGVGSQGSSFDSAILWNYVNDWISVNKINEETIYGVLAQDYIEQSGFVPDYSTIVKIQVLNGSLTSITKSELRTLNKNIASINGRQFAFQTATYIAPYYTISGILWLAPQQTGATETIEEGAIFVLLKNHEEEQIVQAFLKTLSIDDELKYIATEIDSDPNNFEDEQLENAITITYAANAFKPFAPCNSKAVRETDDDIKITWERQDRLPDSGRNTWFNYQTLTNSDEQLYYIEIYDGDNDVRLLSSITETVTYTAAQQVVDFGSVQSSIKCKIYQNSIDVGNGFGKLFEKTF